MHAGERASVKTRVGQCQVQEELSQSENQGSEPASRRDLSTRASRQAEHEENQTRVSQPEDETERESQSKRGRPFPLFLFFLPPPLHAFPCLHASSFSLFFSFPFVASLAEFSTPWINIRYFQLETGRQSSPWYVINAIFMALAFWVARVMIMPAQWALAYGNAGRIASRTNWYPLLCIVTGMTAATFLNLLWFFMIVKGFTDRFLLGSGEVTEFEVVRQKEVKGGEKQD